MAVLYSSTRGGEKGVSASQAILKGLACDGGLFVPNEIPVIEGNLSDWKELSYKALFCGVTVIGFAMVYYYDRYYMYLMATVFSAIRVYNAEIRTQQKIQSEKGESA